MRVAIVGPDGFEPSPPVPKTGVLPLDVGPSDPITSRSSIMNAGAPA